MKRKRGTKGLDGTALGWGFVIGLLAGGIGALFAPKPTITINRQQFQEASQNIRNKLQAFAPVDPIAESIAEGKAAAQRRREQLGLNR